MIVEKILAIAAMLFSLVAVTMKKSWQIFALSAIANLLTCSSFFVLGGADSGMAISLVGGLQCIVATTYAFRDKVFPFQMKIVFFVLYSVFGISNIKEVYDVLPFIASMLCMTAIFQKHPQRIRLLNSLNAATWIAYNYVVGSTALYSQLIFLIMNVVTMFTYRNKNVNTSVS